MRFYVLIILVLFIFAAGCLQQEKNGLEGFLTYERIDFKVRIQYPENWTIKEQMASDIYEETLFYPDYDSSSAKLVLPQVDEFKEPTTLEEYTNKIVSSIQNRPERELFESSKTTLAGNPASKVVYSMDGNKIMYVFTIKNNKLYRLEYVAESDEYPKHLETIQKMIDSFEILE